MGCLTSPCRRNVHLREEAGKEVEERSVSVIEPVVRKPLLRAQIKKHKQEGKEEA